MHPRPASCPLLGSGDLPGALIELTAARIREGLQHIQGPRAACSWGPWDPLGALTMRPVSRILRGSLAPLIIQPAENARKAAAHPWPASCSILGLRGSAWCS